MHLDHDHVSGGAHNHEHTHEHAHAPMEELIALMQYMAGHNAAHNRELADLAAQLESAGSHAAYQEVMAAVADFDKGNQRLEAVLKSLQEA